MKRVKTITKFNENKEDQIEKWYHERKSCYFYKICRVIKSDSSIENVGS